ncbi:MULTISPECIES: hypothetical protein [Xanthomonas]|uniref:Molecular chaperone DnaJ n=1 Tax=Xanthomonas rydalmerensis TaxID=3046274 RepID=A0ABZ0JQ78_9XANT|nr:MULTISPECIES: hypothetical protein [unclassified Xanthomonas]MBB5874994.1 hypothetical protein [Xanthomonas sp. 3498]WOS41961.1 hypothetical protein QN243_05760 [Xanthomonas sp. DM-2023]WOS46147.1 hypothetical protein QN242_05760 [Xanthomonas sp. DM-2023]WOS50325.1 hypothetical protein QN240_05760 [Xanthomonas sp. DM-2023]WOS54505.1 hypothetical protein QN244_05760 [Xanthomonas sp. DM-2023]
MTRPDDDPAGFQQLHETYQAALGWARQFAADRAADRSIDALHADDDALQMQAADAAAAASLPQEAASVAVADSDAARSPPPHVSDTHAATRTVAADDALLELQVAEAPAPRSLPQQAASATAADPGAAPSPPPQASDARAAPRTVAAEWLAPTPADLPPLDIAQMQLRILHQAQRLEPEPLRAWLFAQPELWSLESKSQIGADLQQHLLDHDEEALSTYHYAVLAEFFDWEGALDAPDPYLVQHACARMHRRWLLQPAGHAELSDALRRRGDSAASVPHVRKLLALLGSAPSDGAVLAAMLRPGRPTSARLLLDLIGYVPDGRKPPRPLDRSRAAAWYLAGERNRFTPIAAMLGVARSLIAAAVVLLLFLLLAMIDRNPAPGMSPVLKAGFYAAALIVGGWIAWDAFSSLLRWQSRHEADPCVRRPLLQRFFIPVAAAMATAWIMAGKPHVAAAIALPLLVIAIVRWARRAGFRLQLQWNWGWAWLGFIGLKFGLLGIGVLIVYPQATLGATAIAWLSDLISQRNARRKALR